MLFKKEKKKNDFYYCTLYNAIRSTHSSDGPQ